MTGLAWGVHHRTLAAALVGVGAGVLSGLFGVGGGILIVPGLVLVMELDQRTAHGTSLAAIVPIAVGGAAGYAIEGSVDWPAAAFLAAGGIGGAVLGTHLLGRIPERGLRLLFAVLLLAAAVTLPVEVVHTGVRTAIGVGSALLLVAIGVVAGTMGGLLGVGGGIVMVPGLILLLSVSQAVSKGTSLVVILPLALVGTVRNLGKGHADLRLAAVVGTGGVLSAFGTSLLAVRLDPVVSAVLFGALLVAVAVRLLLAARGRPVPGDRAPERGVRR